MKRAATIPASQNEGYGFFGTMAADGQPANEAWALAIKAIGQATNNSARRARPFLDSRFGRHFADGVLDLVNRGSTLEDAISRAVVVWSEEKPRRRSSWFIGIPAGMSMLDGLVYSEFTHAEA